MKEEGKEISIQKLCRWFGMPRSTLYYKHVRSEQRGLRKLDPVLTEKIREVIDKNPTYGVRRITAMIRRNLNRAVNKKAVHRIMKANGWQVRKKSRGFKKRAPEMSSKAERSNQRWAIDNCSIFCGIDGWCPLTAIIDCHDRCIVGWRLSKSGISKNAASVLEDALIARAGEIRQGDLMLRSDNGLIFGAKAFVEVAKKYGIEQEYITPYTPEQNGMIERFFRTIKEECIWTKRFKSRNEALEEIHLWMDKYHNERPHSALGYETPAEFRKRAAKAA